jgi:hypothetical protein
LPSRDVGIRPQPVATVRRTSKACTAATCVLFLVSWQRKPPGGCVRIRKSEIHHCDPRLSTISSFCPCRRFRVRLRPSNGEGMSFMSSCILFHSNDETLSSKPLSPVFLHFTYLIRSTFDDGAQGVWTKPPCKWAASCHSDRRVDALVRCHWEMFLAPAGWPCVCYKGSLPPAS